MYYIMIIRKASLCTLLCFGAYTISSIEHLVRPNYKMLLYTYLLYEKSIVKEPKKEARLPWTPLLPSYGSPLEEELGF